MVGMKDDGHDTFADSDMNEMTKDDHIEKLKAEIKLLQEEKGKKLASKVEATLGKRMN